MALGMPEMDTTPGMSGGRHSMIDLTEVVVPGQQFTECSSTVRIGRPRANRSIFASTVTAIPTPQKYFATAFPSRGRSIPDFAREADFLRLLPRGADVDPNDPRHGNVMRLRGLLPALGLGRRESAVVAQAVVGGGRNGRGVGLAKKAAALGVPVGTELMGEGEDEEDAGVFRASQEQQVLVFAGKRDMTGPGGGAVSSVNPCTFAFNNHRR